MHRIDGPGATIDNLFTEGNPTLGIPATEVSDDWLNDVQEEIANLIEDQGIVLVKGDQTQLLEAVKLLIGFGGDAQLNIALPNNSGPFDATGLLFNKVNTKAAHISVDIERSTDTQNKQEIGTIFVTHDTRDDLWRISVSSNLDNAGVTFTITAAGQVRALTNNLTGTTYVGELRVAQVLKFKQ